MRSTTNAYPKEQRLSAWSFALKRLSITLEAADEATLYGELIQFTSSNGIVFVRLLATAQEYTVDFRDEPGCFWLAVTLDAPSIARNATTSFTLDDGHMVCARSEMPMSLQFTGDHRVLLLKIPPRALDQRLKALLPEKPRHLSADSGPARLLSTVLRSLADMGNDVTDEELRPVELALPEFLLASLLNDAPARALGGAAGMRAALLERIFQTIEMRLSDPNLNYQQVAAEHGISPRYLQKLFESIDDSFGHYVKVRRLERCRLDLRSPLHVQKSISDILFQWGFNDSASFSRAFREQYGISPRDYRKMPAVDEADHGPDTLRRGRSTAKRAVNDEAAVAPVEELDSGEAETDGVEANVIPAIGDEGTVRHHHLPVSPRTVHWGYFSSAIKPALMVRSGDFVTVETLTHHANDDPERMVEGDHGAESVYRWDETGRAIERRGAGPMSASEFGRGPGEGFGVHICTGPIAIQGAEPGDIIEVRILSLEPRRSGNPRFQGKSFGSNAATFWGFHYNDLLTEPKNREVITIYEVESGGERRPTAHAVYSYHWTPQTDPSGTVHERYDYPGVPVDPETIERNYDILQNVEIPIRPHFGVIALAPAHAEPVDTIPPSAFGGNMDNWRTGPGSSVFLPVQVSGGLLSLGDPHASQGDSELCGTAIECSMTALIQVIRHPAGELTGKLRDLDYPMIETETEWVIMGFSHPDYLKELGEDAQSEVYKRASIDAAMRDAFRKARRFLMTTKDLSEDETISLLSVGVDFGISQVANGNWGVHAIIRKELFTA
ncbi:acetamidase/formamidase/AraC-like DNA-binding protein [Sphingobium sp. B2D3A]|uniref:acetamidase/formamidase family protein n=1 Tax=unclassified Sphingobium TaxID=2611147 RepID=UPI0022248BDA|nr:MULTISPECIES: acetamidase/formamidase family protein [unclassified Sphingobium]MCW2337406.1 acetamidase/formamidase/AraC-like DNA-binding protein [Sphingobium sp. B2D3A]MCW2383864.1 acetamidase/formamidase/AraC-like DNA-binding protein [Sphingobium sp. B2D3D]